MLFSNLEWSTFSTQVAVLPTNSVRKFAAKQEINATCKFNACSSNCFILVQYCFILIQFPSFKDSRLTILSKMHQIITRNVR